MLGDRILGAAADAIGADSLTAVARLGGSDRTEVWRVRDGDTPYVVKAYLDREGGTFAREPAALGALAGAAVAPRLVGVGTDPDLIVMADLGQHPTVADALLGRDPVAAGRAVAAWTDALADLHLLADDAVLDDYAGRLGERAPEVATHRTPQALEHAATRVTELGDRLGIPPPEDFLEALRGLAASFSSPALVLTAADACPDNNLLRPDGAVLLDFEFAEVRHLAWDVAYLRVPWPTCWCSWRLPDDVADDAVGRYRARMAPAVPYVGTDGFVTDLDLATVGWCLMTVCWGAAAAFEEDVVPRLEGPSTRPRLMHRLWLATHLPVADDLDELTSYARVLYRTLARRWGEPSLVLAPAFREDDIAIP